MNGSVVPYGSSSSSSSVRARTSGSVIDWVVGARVVQAGW